MSTELFDEYELMIESYKYRLKLLLERTKEDERIITNLKLQINELKGNSPATDGTGLHGSDQGKVQSDSEVQQGADGKGSGSADGKGNANDDRDFIWSSTSYRRH